MILETKRERFSMSCILQFKRKSYTQAPICFSLLTPLSNASVKEKTTLQLIGKLFLSDLAVKF